MTLRSRWGDQFYAPWHHWGICVCAHSFNGQVVTARTVSARRLHAANSSWGEPASTCRRIWTDGAELWNLLFLDATQTKQKWITKSRKSHFTVLTVFQKCWSSEAQVEYFFFFFYIIHPARLMSSPTASAQRSVSERATHGLSKGSDTANNKVHHYLTLHGWLDLRSLTFSSAISGTT